MLNKIIGPLIDKEIITIYDQKMSIVVLLFLLSLCASVSVCCLSGGHSICCRKLKVGLSDPCINSQKRPFLFFEIFSLTYLWLLLDFWDFIAIYPWYISKECVVRTKRHKDLTFGIWDRFFCFYFWTMPDRKFYSRLKLFYRFVQHNIKTFVS